MTKNKNTHVHVIKKVLEAPFEEVADGASVQREEGAVNSVSEILFHFFKDKGIIAVGELLVLLWRRKKNISTTVENKKRRRTRRRKKNPDRWQPS